MTPYVLLKYEIDSNLNARLELFQSTSLGNIPHIRYFKILRSLLTLLFLSTPQVAV